MQKRLIAILTGSRGEWGYLRPILRLIDQAPDLDYAIIATNMHLLPEFGMSVREIERDGFVVAERVHMTFDGYTAVTMAKSLAVLLLELPTILSRLKPDILLLAGDRGEQLMGAIAGLHLGILVAHIQAGELSGNIDGIIRHSITKLAHIHFAANEEFADRVRKLGEHDYRIFMTGAPLVDELVSELATSEDELREKYRLAVDEPYILAVQHSVTEEEHAAGEQIAETLRALGEIEWPTILIYPNADAGSELIRKQLELHKYSNIRLFRNVSRQDYLALMKNARLMVGNSSSGVMEAPTFGTPAVNIGNRQKGRLQASNVINVGYGYQEIVDAIRYAASDEFLVIAQSAVNPYGDGYASARIVDILRTITIDERLLNKVMAY